MISEEKYIISQAQKSADKYTAKAWIITAKTLYPNNFDVQFEAYKLEKAAKNYSEAAKCFSYIILTFQNQPVELWNEVSELTAALRVPENEISLAQEFYVKMFEHVSYDVQHKILLLTVNNTDNSLEQCKLLLLLLRRFPQAIPTHSPQLLEMIAKGMVSHAPEKYQEMLVEEALPLIYHKTPELPSTLVCRIFTISLEFYTKQIFEDESGINSYDVWKQIFQVLALCGKIMNWEAFLPFNRSWSKDVYWQKLIEIATTNASRTSENKQIFFYTVTLFIFSLHEYNININQKIEDVEVDFALVEGFREWSKDSSAIRTHEQPIEPPAISVTPPCSKEATIAFVTAAHCWQLLNSHEQSTLEISQLLIKLPLSNWFSRFIHDLAVYFGHHEEARKLLGDIDGCTGLSFNIRSLGLILNQGQLTIQGFECILKILQELPQISGNLVENMTVAGQQRHLLLLPLTQKAIIQYCTRAIINSLNRKIFESNCPDLVLGNLLVLAQLEYPRESNLAEQIFTIIRSKRSFSYLLFPNYIVAVDFIEEFMNIWNSNHGEFILEFTSTQTATSGTRRIGTRGADKGVKEDFKHIIKQQTSRCHEDISVLIAKFIEQEHLSLIQSMF
ncbi:integrator complex subunit 10 [Condylostylus longicornis]|uniref:integrator complex subunit 10 n=1 Tax=Condylostylus longicornis TaxID=2530218 RepID=UPI00244DE9EF|nr:integrator complex subunit 10 [Condylostylus longicornis]